jgi:uncharacterized membrane protein
MATEEILPLIFRWLHIFPAIALMGGAIFMRFALSPALQSVVVAEKDALKDAIRSRWAKLVMISILLLLISGLYNAAIKAMSYELTMTYNILLLVKIILAVAIFFLASLLSGRSESAKKFRAQERKWLTLNLTLAILLVCIAGFLKVSPQKEKPRDEPTSAIVDSRTEMA